MLVLTIENAPPKLIGYCSSWAIQISTHVFVANLPAREREVIWKKVLRWAREDTSAVMVWPTKYSKVAMAFIIVPIHRVHKIPMELLASDRARRYLD